MHLSHLALLTLLATGISAFHAFTDVFIENGPFWWRFYDETEEGIAFYAFDVQLGNLPPDVVRFYEVYNQQTSDYFYTISEEEHDRLFVFPQNTWEDGAWGDFRVFAADGPDRVPLHRFWNGLAHFFSIDQNEGLAAGYGYEGIACWVYTAPIDGATAIYRWDKESLYVDP